MTLGIESCHHSLRGKCNPVAAIAAAAGSDVNTHGHILDTVFNRNSTVRLPVGAETRRDLDEIQFNVRASDAFEFFRPLIRFFQGRPDGGIYIVQTIESIAAIDVLHLMVGCSKQHKRCDIQFENLSYGGHNKQTSGSNCHRHSRADCTLAAL